MHLTTVNEIDEKILPEWNAALLYVAQKDQLTHLSILEELTA